MALTSRSPNAIANGPASPGAHVNIWTIQLDVSPHAIEAAKSLLSSEEHARIHAFRHEQARRNYIYSHAALRQILTDCLKNCSKFNPPEIPLRIGPHGKPALAGPVEGRLEFNLTHSGNVALVAVANRSEVGIDVETIRPTPDAARVAERFFSAAESDALRKLPAAEQSTAFLRLWTRKESLTKATGLGIANSLSNFEVSWGTTAAVTAINGDTSLAAQWTLYSFQPAPGYIAALAVHAPGAQFAFHTFLFPHQ